MNVLIIHRNNEEDKINIVKQQLQQKGINGTSLKEDKMIHFTSNIKSWIRDCVTGYTIEGEKRYDGFMVIGRYLDPVGQEFADMIITEGFPAWYVYNGIHPIHQYKLVENQLAELTFLDQ